MRRKQRSGPGGARGGKARAKAADGPAVRVETRDDALGRRLVSTRTLEVGDTVLLERPLVWQQTNKQDVLACSHCGALLGSLMTALRMAAGVVTRHEIAMRVAANDGSGEEGAGQDVGGDEEEEEDVPIGAVMVPCRDGCGELYCSAACEEAHRTEGGHALLCVGAVPDEEANTHEMVQFKMHAMQTNENFLLVADVLAREVYRLVHLYDKDGFEADRQTLEEERRERRRKDQEERVAHHTSTETTPTTELSANDEDAGTGKEAAEGQEATEAEVEAVEEEEEELPVVHALSFAREPFTEFVQLPWWDAAVCPEGMDQTAWEGTLRATVTETVGLLSRGMRRMLDAAGVDTADPVTDRCLSLLLSVENFARIVGMFEQNNIGVRLPSCAASSLRQLLQSKEIAARGRGRGRGRDGDDDEADVDGTLEAILILLQEINTQIDMEAEEGEDADEEEDENGDENGDQCEHDHDHSHTHNRSVSESKSSSGSQRGSSGQNKAQDGKSSRGSRKTKMAADDVVPLTGKRAEIQAELDRHGNVDAVLPPLDGTGLYTLACKMNHSCVPNCKVSYEGGPDTPLQVKVVALQEMPHSVELLQSYVDVELPVEERRRQLMEYGFFCQCGRCREEGPTAAAPHREPPKPLGGRWRI